MPRSLFEAPPPPILSPEAPKQDDLYIAASIDCFGSHLRGEVDTNIDAVVKYLNNLTVHHRNKLVYLDREVVLDQDQDITKLQEARTRGPNTEWSFQKFRSVCFDGTRQLVVDLRSLNKTRANGVVVTARLWNMDKQALLWPRFANKPDNSKPARLR